MRYLGIDLGSRTMGLALSDKLGMIASSLEVVRHSEEYNKLVTIVSDKVSEYMVDGIVLGLPKNMNNTLGPKGELSMSFKQSLENVLSIPVYLQDERLTTRQAEQILISNDTSRKKRKKVIDAMAATIILQSFLDKEGR